MYENVRRWCVASKLAVLPDGLRMSCGHHSARRVIDDVLPRPGPSAPGAGQAAVSRRGIMLARQWPTRTKLLDQGKYQPVQSLPTSTG
jgi:hypothetical protein